MRKRNKVSLLAKRLWAPALLLLMVAASGYIVQALNPQAESPEVPRNTSATR